jgi:hypothetical protein
LGTVELKATLDDGWNLTSLGASIDTKIPETITALRGVAQAAAGLRGRSITNEPGLWRIEFDSTTGSVTKITKVPMQ